MTPDRTHAIIVAIEKYTAGGDLHGPAQDAVVFTGWLIDRGVKRKNIHLFCSPQGASRPDVEQLGVDLHEADHATFVSWFSSANLSGDLLLFLWGGHGICLKEERHLIFADAMKNLLYAIDWKSLRSLLRNGLDFPRQLCFVDACANHAEFGSAKPEPVGIPVFPIRQTDVRQIALFAASPGQRAANPYGRGLFSTVLTDTLANLPAAGVWPLDIDAIGAQINEHFACLRQAGETKQCPAFYSFGDTHLSPLWTTVYEAVLVLQDAPNELAWNTAWQALQTVLRMQDPAREFEGWIRELAREPNARLGPILGAVRNERQQNLFTFTQRRALRAWLDQIDEDLARRLFEENPEFAGFQDQGAWAGAYRACIRLAGYKGSVQPPAALEYLERLAAALNDHDITQVSDEVAEKLGISDKLLQFRNIHARKSTRIASAALVFVVRGVGGQYTFESWFWPDGDTPSIEEASDTKYAVADVIAAASAALKEQVARVEARAEKLRIELALPRELLCEPVETWKVLRGNRESPAFIYFPITVRWSDRLDNPRQWKQWQEAWDALPANALPAPPRFIPDDVDLDILIVELTQNPSARAVVALHFPPCDSPCAADVLSVVLNEGAPIVLWPRGDVPHDAVRAQICDRLFNQAPREYPKLVHELRREAVKEKQASRVVLLYDDYSFIKERGF
jgi:vWA-MoxR associated protein C-terminal domain/Caspase domain